MERVVHIARNHAEAERWDRQQSRSMTPDERRACARELRKRVYGSHTVDLRESREAQVRRRQP